LCGASGQPPHDTRVKSKSDTSWCLGVKREKQNYLGGIRGVGMPTVVQNSERVQSFLDDAIEKHHTAALWKMLAPEATAHDDFQHLFSRTRRKTERIANVEFPFMRKVELKRRNKLVLLCL